MNWPLITIGCVIKTKKRNVSAGQRIVEGLLKNLNQKKGETESKITIGSVMMMTKKWQNVSAGQWIVKGLLKEFEQEWKSETESKKNYKVITISKN